MNQVTYSQKLQHPQWQKRRLEILSRDKFTCQLCGDKETQLHIHHKYYMPGKEAWEYPDDALVSYCKHCHQCVELLKETGNDALVSAKFCDKDFPEFIIVFIVHHKNGETALSIFSNATQQSKFEYKHTISESHIRKMNELLDAAKNLIYTCYRPCNHP